MQTGAADSAYTGRYEGSTIVGQTTEGICRADIARWPARQKTKCLQQTVSQKGKVQRSLYVSPEQRSSLEVFGNYIDALKAKGFPVVLNAPMPTAAPISKT